MLKKLFLVLVMIFFSSTGLFAQFAIMKTDADSLVQRGTNFIYNVQFDSASACFSQVIERYPEHPAGYFLEAMVDWWKIWLYSNTTDKYDDDFLGKINKVMELCDRKLEPNPSDLTYLFFKGGAAGYRARYHTIRKNWLSAASDAKQAYDILIQTSKIAPGNHDIMLGTGIYNYFTIKFQEMYPLIKSIVNFLPRGDKELGLLQLEAAAKHARYSSTEAQVVLLQIYYSFEKDNWKAYEIARELFKNYPLNPYFHKFYGRTLVVMGHMQTMEDVWREILKRYISKTPGYSVEIAREALYYVGYALMSKGDKDMALKYFYKCDEASRVLDEEPSGFMVKVNLKIGQIYDLQGKRKLAIKQYEKVLDMDDRLDSHDLAEKYLKRPYGSK